MMEESYNEFNVSIRKAREKKVYAKSLDTRSIAVMIKKRNPQFSNIPRNTFSRLLNRMFELISEDIFDNGEKYELPYGLGTMYLQVNEHTKKQAFKNIEANMKINWNETLKLWYNDKDAMDNRRFIRFEFRPLRARLALKRGSTKIQIWYFFVIKKLRSSSKRIVEHLNNNDIIGFE